MITVLRVFMVWFLEIGQQWCIIGLSEERGHETWTCTAWLQYCTNYSKRCVFISSVFAKNSKLRPRYGSSAVPTDGKKCGNILAKLLGILYLTVFCTLCEKLMYIFYSLDSNLSDLFWSFWKEKSCISLKRQVIWIPRDESYLWLCNINYRQMSLNLHFLVFHWFAHWSFFLGVLCVLSSLRAFLMYIWGLRVQNTEGM
jgi:hypothetical protein